MLGNDCALFTLLRGRGNVRLRTIKNNGLIVHRVSGFCLSEEQFLAHFQTVGGTGITTKKSNECLIKLTSFQWPLSLPAIEVPF